MWVYGRTDLTDFYAGHLTLRQIKVRLFALPPEAPTWELFRELLEKAQARQRVTEVEDVLAQFNR